MPLLDHFRPPLHPVRHWESFHALWATALGEYLNGDALPVGYFAEVQVHVGSRVEVDVAAFDRSDRRSSPQGGVILATEPAVWLAPEPVATLPAVFPDSVEVLVYADEGGAILASAIELVSPGNKDRPETRQAFVAKCSGYLQQGIGLVIVDIVTTRQYNLHDELSAALGGECPILPKTHLYASAYRPVRQQDSEHTDVWTSHLSLGGPLPTLPLSLRRGPAVPLDLDATYSMARRRSRFDRTHDLPVE